VQGGVVLAPAPGADAAGSAGSIARLRLATGMGEDLDAIELAISQDVGLALRLLRYLNSAAFGLRSRISSIRQAVHMLGPRTVRQWAMLVVVADVGGAASPLVTIALGRARLCEAIAARFGQADTAAYFACGLLSVADALCRRPMRDVVADLPLSDDVVAALLDREGGKGRALRMVELVEAGRADEAAAGPLAADTLRALHTAALRWSDQTVGGLAS
jgi:EAL and modified HD-GYP domain-containing signal transduction protein